ncbi:uncharacterized protein CIMG_12821 [Coccidioides immitis RS]|uniref:Uncharacterized protein n=1 Tax=Coccidioides immitis (strain RS) TaxID=246410 RepID=A0A0D8JTG5_COCIM|nr:uncharacterized protein CIMG_12821 [Coccidioides immitis RS]KJF60246.1 hypothetical protein CIMG_12821 [Coccidioides immitis RS]
MDSSSRSGSMVALSATKNLHHLTCYFKIHVHTERSLTWGVAPLYSRCVFTPYQHPKSIPGGDVFSGTCGPNGLVNSTGTLGKIWKVSIEGCAGRENVPSRHCKSSLVLPEEVLILRSASIVGITPFSKEAFAKSSVTWHHSWCTYVCDSVQATLTLLIWALRTLQA